MSKILVVVIDALRPDFLSCYGHPYSDISRAIDFHAGRGSVFLQAHGGANTPHATSLLLTGNKDYKMDEWKISLRKNGKTLLDFFPNFYLMTANLIPRNLFIESGADEARCLDAPFPGEMLTDKAISHLEKVGAESDWLYIVWYMDVHEYKGINIAKYPGTKRSQEEIALDDAMIGDYKDILRYSQYSCAVRYVDICIERLINRLKKLEIQYDWLVIMSDHGEYLKPYYTHGIHWQYQVTHIPLIIRGMETTMRNSVTVKMDLCDVAATLVDLSGQRIPNKWCGKSLKQYLRSND